MWVIMCQTGTDRLLKHATKNYLTSLISETDMFDRHKISSLISFVNAILSKTLWKIFLIKVDQISQIITVLMGLCFIFSIKHTLLYVYDW
jgi:hypothetical protein